MESAGKLETHLQLSETRKPRLDECVRWSESVLKAEPGLTEVISHCINTGDAPHVRSMAYQIPSKWKEKVRKEIEELKQMGILVPSYSTWNSPIVPVAKPDGNVRVCVDFRRVNKLTVQDQYHIPLVAQIVDKVGNAGFLSKLDLNKGFYQVKMSEEDRAKTAIVTAFGKYEFSRMPFGLVMLPVHPRDLWTGSWRVCMNFVLPTSVIYSSSVRTLRRI